MSVCTNSFFEKKNIAEHLATSISNPTPDTEMPQLPPEPAGRCSNKLQVSKTQLFCDVLINKCAFD